jgi:hypothetical protein
MVFLYDLVSNTEKACSYFKNSWWMNEWCIKMSIFSKFAIQDFDRVLLFESCNFEGLKNSEGLKFWRAERLKSWNFWRAELMKGKKLHCRCLNSIPCSRDGSVVWDGDCRVKGPRFKSRSPDFSERRTEIKHCAGGVYTAGQDWLKI